jgi:arginyl-tRNA--protein-N-Asp/Glu arginylyltransferase
MKLFYSELSANPAYYSFGYSIYGELETEDTLDESYEQGFLPFVGAKDQSGKMMYMGRGVRVLAQEFEERHYHARVLRKIASLGSIVSTCHALTDFPITDEFIAFVLRYFAFRFGKESMSEQRLRAMLNSGFITHIREYKINGSSVAYTLEVQGTDFIHTWYHAYAKHLEGSYFGLYIYIDILRTLKKEGKKYLYLGITYGRWMSYKTNFQPLTFWNGKEWIVDTKSVLLKKLLDADSLRLITYTDSWRDAHSPYYAAPYKYADAKYQLRLLLLILTGLPRLALLGMLAFALLFGLIVIRLFFG